MMRIYRFIKRLLHICKMAFLLVYLFCVGRIASLIQKLKKHREDYPIDFVVTWVDDSDPEWIKEKQKYAGEMTEKGSNTEARYRDWGTLVYWFRAVEQYAPWVNHVYLVTCGHKPSWLNLGNDKLRFVTHEDFIPKAYLPTFECAPIELNIWRIPGLSEHFVYFNDDMFLNRSVTPEDFFRNGLPKECAIAKPLYVSGSAGLSWKRMLLNDYSVINSSFNIRECIRQNPAKWFSYVIGWDARFNLRLYVDGYVAGMVHPHLTRAFLKQTFEDLWNRHPELLDETSRKKFRDSSKNTNQLVALWTLFSGNYYPVRKDQIGTSSLVTSETIERITKELLFPKHNVICINDGDNTENSEFEKLKQIILETFSQKLPEKSTFEL